MKIYSHTDSEVESFLQKIPKVAQQIKAINLPYWIFVLDSNPIGIVVVGKEPMQLLASPGTAMALIALIDTNQPKENIETFASETLKLAIPKKVEYALVKLPFDEDVAINQFKKVNFKEYDEGYQMACQLEKTFKPSKELQFTQVKKEEMPKFMKLAEKILQGTPDIALKEALEHFHELPEEFLDSWYTKEKFYLAQKMNQAVGILNLDTTKGLINNIGVDPQQRGKGYGKQIMLFGLQQLQKNGCKQANLGVHVENKPAIHLYESVGFLKAKRYKRLIWRKGLV